MYIYRQQKMNENTIYVNYFLNELKFKLDFEKTICETNNTLTQLNKKSTTSRLDSLYVSHISLIQSNCFSLSRSLNMHVYLWCLSVLKIILCHQKL